MTVTATKRAVHTDVLPRINPMSEITEISNTDIKVAMPSLIETIRDPNDATKLLSLKWENGKASIVPHLVKDGKVCAPPGMDFANHRDLRLPDRIMPYGDLQELLAQINSTICKFVDLSNDDAFLVSLYVLSTWFPDVMKAAPYLWLVGPLGSGKSTLLKFLHCVSRRALLVGDVRPAALYKLPSVLCPTLLIDEVEPDGSRMGAEVQRLLRIGNTPGVSAPRNGQLFQTFCSKVISSRHPPVDVALASRAIVIRLLPTQRELLSLDESNMAEIARTFQPKLLAFRVENYASVQKSRVAFERMKDLTPRIRDLVQGMGAPLLGNMILEDKLIEILREFDREARMERSLEPEWLVIDALFALCHEHFEFGVGDSHVLVGGLSSYVNKILSWRGEDLRMTARGVGGVLKSLGIRTIRLGKLGRGLTLTSAMKTKIHELARRFGFDRLDFATLAGLESGYGGQPCLLCEKTGLTAGLKFFEPRTRPLRKLQGNQRGRLFDQNTAASAKQEVRCESFDELTSRQTDVHPAGE